MRPVVFFDLDDTLFDWPTAVERTLAKMQAAYPDLLGGLPMPVMRDLFLDVTRHVFEDVDFSGSSLANQRRARFETFLSNLGRPTDRAMELNDFYYANFAAKGALLPNAVEALQAVGECHYLGVMSNGIRAVQIKKLEENGLLDVFKWVIFSEDAQINKPSAGIYEFAARRACVADGDPLPVYVGNDLIKDMWGAKMAGWKTVWLNRRGVEPREYVEFIDREIGSLAEVPAAVEELTRR